MDIEIGATGLTRLDENCNTDGLQDSHNDKSYTESSPYRYEEITMLMIFALDTLKLLMTAQIVYVDQAKQNDK